MLSQSGRQHPERRTAGGVTPASSQPAHAEDFTRTRPAPMSTAVKETVPALFLDTPALQHVLRQLSGGPRPVRVSMSEVVCTDVRSWLHWPSATAGRNA